MEKIRYRRGFTYVEVIMTISIVVILSLGGYIKYERFKESIQLREAKLKIEEIYSRYIIKSLDTKEKYEIILDLKNENIEVFLSKLNVRLENIELPKKLKYATIYDEVQLSKIKSMTTLDGNLSNSFTVYIFDYDGLAKYRIAFYNYQPNKFLKINIYKNMGVKDATYKNIVKYHKSIEAKNHIGWKLE